MAPNCAEAQAARGLTLAAYGNFAVALQAFSRAIQLAPQDAETHYLLGRLYFSQGLLPAGGLDAGTGPRTTCAPRTTMPTCWRVRRVAASKRASGPP